MQIDGEMTLLNQAASVEQLRAALNARTGVGGQPQVDPSGVVPADVVRFLARLRLLEGVPFNYLVPDAALLPLESVRFFYIDRNWLDALVQGALSVGTVTSADRAKLAELYPIVRREVDVAERMVRTRQASDADEAVGPAVGAAGPMTGFLMRSRIVSGWPALHVRAYATDDRADDATDPELDDSPDRIRLLRLERLAPAVLLVLFDGVPAVVHVEEPRSGIQFGVRVNPGAAGRASAVLPLRDVRQPNAGFLGPDGDPRTVQVPFRRGAPGVLDLQTLARRLSADPDTRMTSAADGDDQVDSAEFAIQMLRFPLRQVFGDTAVDRDWDSFFATISTATLDQRFTRMMRSISE